MIKVFKRIAIASAIYVTTLLMIVGCSIEEKCGTVQAWYTNPYSNCQWELKVDGEWYCVSRDTFLKAEIGDYICLY